MNAGRPLTLTELRAWADAFDANAATLEIWRRDWPLVIQSTVAYRTHIAEQRELLKWIAAFSSAGLFVTITSLRSMPQPVMASTAIGAIAASIAFLASIASAGVFWWRIDLVVGRYLEAMQHRVNHEITELGAFLLGLSELKRAIDAGDVGKGNAHQVELRAIADGLIARGSQKPLIPGSDREATWLKWLGAAGYSTGIAVTVVDQLLRMAPC